MSSAVFFCNSQETIYLMPYDTTKLENRRSVKEIFSKENIFSPKIPEGEGMVYYHHFSKLPFSPSLHQVLSRLI